MAKIFKECDMKSEREIALSAIKAELMDYFKVLVDDGHLKPGYMQPHDFDYLSHCVLKAIDSANIEVQELYHEMSLEEASRSNA